MSELEKSHEQHIELIKTQNESQLNLAQKEHQNELSKLNHRHE